MKDSHRKKPISVTVLCTYVHTYAFGQDHMLMRVRLCVRVRQSSCIGEGQGVKQRRPNMQRKERVEDEGKGLEDRRGEALMYELAPRARARVCAYA